MSSMSQVAITVCFYIYTTPYIKQSSWRMSAVKVAEKETFAAKLKG